MIQRRTLDTLPVCLLILGQSGDTANRPMSKRVTQTSPGFNVEGQRGSKEASEAFRYTLHGKTESSLSLDTGVDLPKQMLVWKCMNNSKVDLFHNCFWLPFLSLSSSLNFVDLFSFLFSSLSLSSCEVHTTQPDPRSVKEIEPQSRWSNLDNGFRRQSRCSELGG